MAIRPNPLVPLSLFRNREFATINLATFLIYGALYVSFTYTALLYQGTLGYSATGAAIIGLPSGVLLASLSARVGGLVARYGSRMFLVTGPLIVGAGQLWLARIPATSKPWLAELGRPGTLIPPIDAIVDVLPAVIAFGAGMAMVVAPLTSTLMGSIPSRNSGLGSAINNALSRVGQPLVGAVIFVAITASFYSALAAHVPGLDPSDPAVRAAIVPLNPPKPDTAEAVVAAAKVASVDAFHLAALVSAGLMVAGAAMSWFGLLGPALALELRAGFVLARFGHVPEVFVAGDRPGPERAVGDRARQGFRPAVFDARRHQISHDYRVRQRRPVDSISA